VKYTAFAMTAFRTRFAYRSQVWAQVLGGIVRVVAAIAVWQAVLGDGGNAAGISLDQMVTYAAIASSMLGAYNWEGLVQLVGQQIRSGDVAVFLVKPLSYPLMLLANDLGQLVFRLLCVTLPVIGVAALVYGLTPPGPVDAVLFVLFWLLGFAILFLLALIAGLLAFWLMTAFSLEWTLQALITLLGGTFIPLWFFPEPFGAAVGWLPFAWIGFYPAAVWLGTLEVGPALLHLAAGVGWAVLLALAAGVLWRRAARQITVQGG
jgi:ABC-2 type transport system permease protein